MKSILNLNFGFGHYDAKKTYLAIVDTINPNANFYENQVEKKIVVLIRDGKKEQPRWNDYEYYNVKQKQLAVSFLPPQEKVHLGRITEEQLQRAIVNTGYEEAKRLSTSKTKGKTLKKIA